MAAVTAMIDRLENTTTSDKNAYRGALLMKKAGYQKTPKDKLSLFKQGRLLLEKEIETNSKNTEYHFLRLIIQENAPKMLKYNTNIVEDAAWVKKHYTEVNSDVRSAIVNYSKTSVNLKL